MHPFGKVHPNQVLATLLRSGADYLGARARLLEQAAYEQRSDIRFECDRLLREIARRSESTPLPERSRYALADVPARTDTGLRPSRGPDCAEPFEAKEPDMSTLTIELRDEQVARLKALAERRGTDIDRLIEQMATVMFAHFDSETRLLASSCDASDARHPAHVVDGQAAYRREANEARR